MKDADFETEHFEKTYRKIRNLFEQLFGEEAWERLPVPSSAKRSKAKAQPLPFGSKTKLTPEERARYTLAKRILAAVTGLPTSGWGLYGRTIASRIQEHLEDEEKRKKLERATKKLHAKIKKHLKE